ncbi:MAG: hypothetical protein ONA90_11420, partial [candidate division KSB1 bacterium]|nr:hypothetical protein [candidate division KSB1 bacterium]
MKKFRVSRAAAIVIMVSIDFGLFTLAWAKPRGDEVNRIAIAGGKEMNAEVLTPAATLDSRLVAANSRFGFNLFSKLVTQEHDKNIFISPSSIAFALAMTYNGAAEATQQAMAKALELQGMSLQDINQANAELRTMLENPDPKVQLTIANSLWTRKGVSFKPAF